MRTLKAIAYRPKQEAYEITLDLSSQVLRLIVPDDRDYPQGDREGKEEATIFPSFKAAGFGGPAFLPAAALAFKAKQVDDGIYAAVELALSRGCGKSPGKTEFLRRLVRSILDSGDAAGAPLVAAAAALGGDSTAAPAEAAAVVQALSAAFLADDRRSKPLGFYTWSDELVRVFRRDRMLQTELDAAAAASVARALARDEGLSRDYDALVRLPARLTGPLAWGDLRSLAAATRGGQPAAPDRRLSIFPPSRAHETELVKRLYGDRQIPESFSLADALLRGIREGSVHLEPGPDSGWYDHQTYALEALAIPEKMPEAKRLEFEDSYREELAGLFKALLALTRETHVKQLEFPLAGARAPGPELILNVKPSLSVEPLAAYFLRRARSYRFVRGVLEEALGADALPSLRRLTAGGSVDLTLDRELLLLEGIFRGAYLTACDEIGLEPEDDRDLGTGRGSAADQALFKGWKDSLDQDPDLEQDIRMMVPVFYDLGRRKTKVWAVLGVSSRPLSIAYKKLPRVASIRSSDGAVVPSSKARVEFETERQAIAYIVSAEVYVDKILDRDEFRAHCDRKKSFRRIVDSLR